MYQLSKIKYFNFHKEHVISSLMKEKFCSVMVDWRLEKNGPSRKKSKVFSVGE